MNEKLVWIELVITIIGVMFIGLSLAPTELGLNFFIIGLPLTICGSYFLCLEMFPSLKKNKHGILWIWAVCLMAIVVMALAWMTLTWPVYLIIEQIESVFTFPTAAQSAVDILKTVIAWFLVLFVLGMLLWAYVNSQRREDVTYPAY
jgi:hypothetical protein